MIDQLKKISELLEKEYLTVIEFNLLKEELLRKEDNPMPPQDVPVITESKPIKEVKKGLKLFLSGKRFYKDQAFKVYIDGRVVHEGGIRDGFVFQLDNFNEDILVSIELNKAPKVDFEFSELDSTKSYQIEFYYDNELKRISNEVNIIENG